MATPSALKNVSSKRLLHLCHIESFLTQWRPSQVQAPAMNIPTDEQFFSKTEKGKPDIAFLKNHFYREGRIKEEHALHIIENATEILHAEPNLLHVDAPVTGESFSSSRLLSCDCFNVAEWRPLSVCGDIHGQYVRFGRRTTLCPDR
jgi:hypothetical protein